MAGRNVTARFSVEADVAQAKRDLEGITQQVDQLGKTKVDNVRQELEQLTASTGKLAGGYTALTQEQRQAYQQREQDAQSVERLRRSYKTLEGALEAVDVQVQHGHRSAEEAVRIQGLLTQAYGRTNAAIAQNSQAFQGGVNATRAAIVAQESAALSTQRLNGVVQQAGWQVSDFANQMANGGNVATAAGMQLGQLLGSLGPMGEQRHARLRHPGRAAVHGPRRPD
jgi:chromosome segregation ATPase